MKIAELKQQIAAAGGKLAVSDLTFVHRSDEDIDIHADTALIAWVPKSAQDGDEVREKISIISGSQALEFLSELGQLAHFIGVEVKGIQTNGITREVTKEVLPQGFEDIALEKHKLAGKVEAYENILIGRSISAS